MSEDIPQAWRLPLERKGIKPSYRALGEKAGVAHETVRGVALGRKSKASTIRKIADAMGVDPEFVHELRGTVAPDVWEPPPASSLLTREERDAIARLIVAVTKGRETDEHGSASERAGGSPAREEEVGLISTEGIADPGPPPRRGAHLPRERGTLR